MEIKHGEKRVEEKERGLQRRKCFDKIGKIKTRGAVCLSLSKLAGIRKKTEKGKTTQMENWGKSLACVITNDIIVHFGNIDSIEHSVSAIRQTHTHFKRPRQFYFVVVGLAVVDNSEIFNAESEWLSYIKYMGMHTLFIFL